MDCRALLVQRHITPHTALCVLIVSLYEGVRGSVLSTVDALHHTVAITSHNSLLTPLHLCDSDHLLQHTSLYNMLCHIMSYQVISCHIISYHIMSYHIMSYHVISCHIMSYHVISCHIMSYHVMSYHIISCHIMSYHVMSYHVISYHIISCHIMSYHVMSYHVMQSVET